MELELLDRRRKEGRGLEEFPPISEPRRLTQFPKTSSEGPRFPVGGTHIGVVEMLGGVDERAREGVGFCYTPPKTEQQKPSFWKTIKRGRQIPVEGTCRGQWTGRLRC